MMKLTESVTHARKDWNLGLFLPSVDYRETLASIRGRHYRVNWLCRQRRVDQIPDGPDPIGNAKAHAGRGTQGLMDAAQIVVRATYSATAAQCDGATVEAGNAGDGTDAKTIAKRGNDLKNIKAFWK